MIVINFLCMLSSGFMILWLFDHWGGPRNFAFGFGVGINAVSVLINSALVAYNIFR